jgi:tRNA threonylcarbamoyladenosine biosynthesis protein TsaE
MQSSVTIPLPSLEETMRLGRRLGRAARPGDIFTLSGDLGAGKTTLTQAIGQGMEVPADCYITSPTFSLLHEYPGRLPIFHMDLYRLGSATEIVELGFEEYLYDDGLAIIEWPDRLQELMPRSRLDIHLTLVDENARLAVLTAYGDMQPRIASLLPQ